MRKVNKLNLFFIIVISVFLIVILIGSLILAQLNPNSKKIIPSIASVSNISCILNNNTVVSFEIDDVTFSPSDTSNLENALYLADKYHITFDLGVIALPFSENMDNDTFSLYQNNQDDFEIIAHGFTHALDQSIIDQSNSAIYGEFYIFPTNQSVPYSIQDNHIKRMREIFQDYNLTTATEIFTIPYHTGDFNTTLLAEKYGYKLILQKITVPKSFSEVQFGNITASQNYIDIPEHENFTNADVVNYTSQLNQAILLGQKRIDISFHLINFDNLSAIDNFFGQILSQTNNSVVYRMLSDRFNCNY
jgi:hypothetical protein